MHRVLLTELDDPDKFAEFYAIFHADSLLGTGMFAQNTGWLLRETGERQEKVSVELYRSLGVRLCFWFFIPGETPRTKSDPLAK